MEAVVGQGFGPAAELLLGAVQVKKHFCESTLLLKNAGQKASGGAEAPAPHYRPGTVKYDV